jgi:enterochelin esterase family protein
MPGVPFIAVRGHATTAADAEAIRSLSNVRLLDQRDDVLSCTTILLAPTQTVEAFNVSCIEAMLRGIPVLTSDVGGMPEATLGGGFVLPADDVVAWHGCVESLLADRGAYELHAGNCRRAAETFVHGLSITPLAEELERLSGENAAAGSSSQQGSTAVASDASARASLADLSPEQLALLVARVGRKKRAPTDSAVDAHAPLRVHPRGRLEETRFRSAVLQNARTLFVYTPAGMADAERPHELLVVFDGLTFKTLISAPEILDDLIARHLIPPSVAVLVDNLPTPDGRLIELTCSRRFTEFVASELIPWVRQRYAVTRDAAGTVIGGASLGALAAGFAALTHPDLFGNVLSLSGSFVWKPDGDPQSDWLTRQFAKMSKRELRFSLEVGLGEPAAMHAANRLLRDTLAEKGYAVRYYEFDGGHDHVAWRPRFADSLVYLLGQRVVAERAERRAV